jgi:hypothetical protein
MQPLKPLMSAHGYKRSGSGTWLRDDVDTIAEVWLQRSPFSEKYYVNLGVYCENLENKGTGWGRALHCYHFWDRLAEHLYKDRENLWLRFDSMRKIRLSRRKRLSTQK